MGLSETANWRLASQGRISSVKWRLERQAGLFNSALQPSYKTVAVPPSPTACFGTSIFAVPVQLLAKGEEYLKGQRTQPQRRICL
jgi:hypothetical protein